MIPPFVDTAWLAEHRGDVVLADVRWYLDGRSGREAYDRGHLPGAVFVDLDAWLAGRAGDAEGRHPLPDPDVFARGMASLGIGDGDTVVAYDDAGGVIAARLVWMLRVTGRAAALLDGGLLAYDGPLEQAPPERPAATFTARPWPAERLAGMDDAADRANVVLDARDRARFLGGEDPVDPRPGHIPGARSVPCRENVDAQGRLLGPDELRARFEGAGVSGDASVVSYCGSGVTACHTLLALEQVGFASGRLYPGSYSQWSRSDRQIETDEFSPAPPSTPVDIP
jgi:thiosulfate/3-mercaptopyruvate sulfurtransferase